MCGERAGWDVDGFYGMEIGEENKKLPVVCTSPPVINLGKGTR